jgi:putative NADH-flavin reductase
MMATKSLKVAVIGPTGQCGSCVVDELLSRGHQVVGISRNPPMTWKMGENMPYTGVPVHIHDTDRSLSKGFDAIVCAFALPLSDLTATYEIGVEGHGKIRLALLNSAH